jgi:hypothetical protein
MQIVVNSPRFQQQIPAQSQMQAPAHFQQQAAPQFQQGRAAPQAPVRQKGKLQHLHITDSIGRNMIYPTLENSTGSLILPVRATPSVYDERAFNPQQNVQSVLQSQLSTGARYHAVIFGAPRVDITNQDVSRGALEQNKVETMTSVQNMVEAANYALETGQVEQVIIMQHFPRWDTHRDDPYGAKPLLAELANNTLLRMVDESRHSDRIMVGVHSGLQVEGQAMTDMMTNHGDNWNSRNVKQGKFDGVHYYSRQGQEALTASMLEVLRQAGLVRQARASAPRVADNQWKVVSRGPRGAAPAPAPFNIPLYNRFMGN